MTAQNPNNVTYIYILVENSLPHSQNLNYFVQISIEVCMCTTNRTGILKTEKLDAVDF